MKKLLLSVCAFSLTLATLQAGEITKLPGGDLTVRYDTAFSGHQ